jgi:PKD repeat protein
MHQTRITILLTLALLVGSGALAAQAFSPPPPADAPSIVRLYVRDRDHLNEVAGELDIWETHPTEKYVVAAVTPAQYRWLESLGYQLEIDAEKTSLLGIQAALDPRFYYFDDHLANSNGLYVVDFLQEINAAYPNLTELIDIGDAWMAGQPDEHDRDIWVLRITNENPSYGPIEEKPAFFLFATIHAREVAVPELAIRYIRYLTESYDGEGGYDLDPDVTWLVNHNVVYVLVMQNPDGHTYNEQNIARGQRKNMNSNYCLDGHRGVDLNRNHSFLWNQGGSSDNPCSETYHGPSRASEPETQAFESYFATVMRDQNGSNDDDEIPPAAPITTTGVFITLHSYGDLVLWPWGHTIDAAPDGAQMQTIGRKFAYYNNYAPEQASDGLYFTSGATDDWTYGKFGIPSYTFEVGPLGGSCGGFFPAYGCIDGIDGMPRNFWAENKPTFLYAHKIARTPYMTAYGPDAENLAVAPDTVFQSLPVQLTAAIADHRYGGDTPRPIAAAEYFIDEPGDDGDGAPMAPNDGGWGGQSENVTATLDTSNLAPGQHYFLVHGQNDEGDWGPFTAVFVTVLTPTYGLVLTPTTAAQFGAPGATAIYTLTLENTSDVADAYTIGVTATWPTTPSLTGVGPVNPGGAVDLTVVVAIPSSASEGDFDAATVTASGSGVSASSVLTTTVPCVEITDVELTLTTLDAIYTGTLVEFEADVAPDNASMPYTYTINYGAGPSAPAISSADPLTAALNHVFTSTGVYTVEIAVWNCEMTGPVTGTVEVVVNEYEVCVDLTGIAIAGDATGYPGVYTFTTSYQPPNGSLPITYTWNDGSAAATLVRALDVGTFTLVVTATNCTAALVTDTHTIVIRPTPCITVAGVDVTFAPTTPRVGQTITFTSAVTQGALPITYTWTFGDDTPPLTGVGLDVVSHTYSVAGFYTVTLEAANACPSSASQSTLVKVTAYRFYLPVVMRSYPDLIVNRPTSIH